MALITEISSFLAGGEESWLSCQTETLNTTASDIINTSSWQLSIIHPLSRHSQQETRRRTINFTIHYSFFSDMRYLPPPLPWWIFSHKSRFFLKMMLKVLYTHIQLPKLQYVSKVYSNWRNFEKFLKFGQKISVWCGLSVNFKIFTSVHFQS